MRKAGVRAKEDERILGNSDSVEDVLRLANEAFEEKYELKSLGYDIDRVISRVAESMGMGPNPDRSNPSEVQSEHGLPLRYLLIFFDFWGIRSLGEESVDQSVGLDLELKTLHKGAGAAFPRPDHRGV